MTLIAYVAACAPEGGIYSYQVGEDGKLTPLGKTPFDRPHFLAVEGNTMYAVLREPYGAVSADSGLTTLPIAPDGQLGTPGPLAAVGGRCAAHLLAVNGAAYTANYLSGSITKIENGRAVKIVAHHGRGVNPERQEAPHPHQVLLTPDKKYISAVDLGLDKIMFYDLDLNLVREFAAPRPGLGIRHLVYSGEYAFCANELDGSVTVYQYHDAQLTALETYPTLPAGYVSPNGNICAAIRATRDGKYVIVSNRGHDSLACFRHSAGKLECYGIIPCGGIFPRDFAFTPDEKFLYCCNERSHDISGFAFCGGTLIPLPERQKAEGALCVVFHEAEK